MILKSRLQVTRSHGKWRHSIDCTRVRIRDVKIVFLTRHSSVDEIGERYRRTTPSL